MSRAMAELGELIRTQDDSHMTADPIFCVFGIERIYTDNNPDDYEWLNTDSQEIATRDEYEKMEADFDASDEIPEGWCRIGYIDRKTFVTACLTRKGAERYIDANGHNLNQPHIYVMSLFRNEEMLAVRNHLISGEI
jgi:hypothetical protein